MKKQFWSFIFLMILASDLSFGQTELNIPKVVFGPEYIKSSWVTHPEIRGGEDVAVLFRNSFYLEEKPKDFILNISGDNHYFLYVNGKFFNHGPQLGEITHWKYETVNIADYLVSGKNVLAVKLVNYGKRRSLGIQSVFTCLLVNGLGEAAPLINTNAHQNNWKCTIDSSFSAKEVNWREPGPKDIVGGFYANNPTDFVDFRHFAHDWNQKEFDDSLWTKTVFFESANSMGGSIAYILEPRNVPMLTWENDSPGTIVRSNFTEYLNFDFSKSLLIPANSDVTFLIDKKSITNGFPIISFSDGKNSQLKISYAENLFRKDHSKPNRDEVSDHILIGYSDSLICDGTINQVFQSTAMRTFRYIEFNIKTQNQPLTINGFHYQKSDCPVKVLSSFKSDDSTYNRVYDICRHTVELCTKDYFMSDAYYETMQYVGDTKIQALLWQAMTGDLYLTQNALLQFAHSIDNKGNILGCYPSRSTFIYPTYSLIWVDMLFDYLVQTNDQNFLKQFKSGIQTVIDGFGSQFLDKNLLVKGSGKKYRYFVDWYSGPENGSGTATKNEGLHSAVVTLHYVNALYSAAKVMEVINEPILAKKYQLEAKKIKNRVFKECFSSTKNILAERPDHSVFDQHSNIMGILTDAIPLGQQNDVLNRIVQDSVILTSSYYYRYYLFKAIQKADRPDLFETSLKPWFELISQNMTTTLERMESPEKPTRSEVHPWSASPLWYFFTYLAGINPKKYSYEEIEINPAFGKLNKIQGEMGTPVGSIIFNLTCSAFRGKIKKGYSF